MSAQPLWTGATCPRCHAVRGHVLGCLQAAAGFRSRVIVDALVIPSGWSIERRVSDGAWFLFAARGRPPLSAILSVEAHGAALWLHMSVAADRRVPTWEELRDVKSWLLGDVEAYMVAPPRARYVNIHPDVLHLFAPVDQECLPLPDFTAGTGSL